MDKILVCITGVVNRSIKYTWPSIKDNIVDLLKIKYSVDIAVFNNNVEDCRIDNRILNNTELEIIPYNFLFEYKQVDLDKEINNVKGSEKDFPPNFSGKGKQNGLRLMCMERKVVHFIEKNQEIYTYLVIINADYFFLNPLSLEILSKVDDDTIGTCYHLDFCNGYTDGFYIGKPKTIQLLLNRINSYYELILPYISILNYEILLKRFFLQNKIKRLKVPIFFVKIRANLTLFPSKKKVVMGFIAYLDNYKKKYSVYQTILDNIRPKPTEKTNRRYQLIYN